MRNTVISTTNPITIKPHTVNTHLTVFSIAFTVFLYFSLQYLIFFYRNCSCLNNQIICLTVYCKIKESLVRIRLIFICSCNKNKIALNFVFSVLNSFGRCWCYTLNLDCFTVSPTDARDA